LYIGTWGWWAKTKEGWVVGFGCPLVISGSSLSSVWWQISLKSVMIEDGQVHRPESYERERTDSVSNFVATWLSRIRGRPHIFLGLGQFGTFLTVVSDNLVLFDWSWRIV